MHANLAILATPVRVIGHQVVSLGQLGGFIAFYIDKLDLLLPFTVTYICYKGKTLDSLQDHLKFSSLPHHYPYTHCFIQLGLVPIQCAYFSARYSCKNYHKTLLCFTIFKKLNLGELLVMGKTHIQSIKTN